MAGNILLVGICREVHPKAAALGFRLSLLIAADKLRKSDDLSIYHRIVVLPASADSQEWIAHAKLLQQFENFDGIGVFSEPAEFVGAEIARALNLPYHALDVINSTHRKNEMRACLNAAGVEDTACRLASEISVASAEAFASEYGYPFIMKPVDGCASLGVSLVRNAAEIDAALEWFANGLKSLPGVAESGQLLLEQYLDGSEWSAEGFSENGIHKVVCITRKFKGAAHFVETGHSLPADLPQALASDIRGHVCAALDAIGIANGPSHTELIVTKNGPRIVETHTRPAGDCIVDLIRLASGVDLDELWIRQVAGESVLHLVPELQAGPYVSIQYATPAVNGTLLNVEGVTEAESAGNIAKLVLLRKPGELIERDLLASSSRSAYAIAHGETEALAIDNARQALKKLQFHVSCAG